MVLQEVAMLSFWQPILHLLSLQIYFCKKFYIYKWKTPQEYCVNQNKLNLDAKMKSSLQSKQTKILLNSQGDKIQWTVSDVFFINLY